MSIRSGKHGEHPAAAARRPVSGSLAGNPALTRYRTKHGKQLPEAPEAANEEAEDGDEDESLAEPILRSAPPWLVSAVFHMALLLVLALIWFANVEKRPPVTVTMPVSDAMEDLNSDGEVKFDLDLPNDDLALVQDSLPENDPFTRMEAPTIETPEDMGFVPAPQVSIGLRGRTDRARQALLGRYGGTQESEEAVRRALIWLAKQQRQDGSWSLKGPYEDGGSGADLPPAATAMALIAFQGNGNTHQRGLYQKQVEEGIRWLVNQQEDSGRFPVATEHDQFYTHALCTIAICELYGMSQDSWLRHPAEQAVAFCVQTQSHEGGWRYGLANDGRSQTTDLSVTGWVVMALQSARMAGLTVPTETLEHVTRYLDVNSADSNGTRYAYTLNSRYTSTMTAEGLLCRQYLGWGRDDKRLQNGVTFLLSDSNMPGWGNGERNVYYWYYATQVMHHVEGDSWTKWNNVMRDLLVDHQQLRGAETGSWEPSGDMWGGQGGRLFVTCLSVYILEVYYRHMPLYSDVRLPR